MRWKEPWKEWWIAELAVYLRYPMHGRGGGGPPPLSSHHGSTTTWNGNVSRTVGFVSAGPVAHRLRLQGG